jgi:hypothetical protein
LPGTAFGFGDLSHLQKAETEFAERSRRGRARAGRDLRGFSGSPALVTVHQPPNSNDPSAESLGDSAATGKDYKVSSPKSGDNEGQ